jgi:hypothetical protein
MRESSSALMTTQVSKHKDVSESGFTTTPSARKLGAGGFVRMAIPRRSDTKWIA